MPLSRRVSRPNPRLPVQLDSHSFFSVYFRTGIKPAKLFAKDLPLKRYVILSLALLFLTPSPGRTQPPETALIKTMRGEVLVLRQGRAFRAWPHFTLEEKDTVRTGGDGYAGLLFKDGTVITLGPRSQFTIQHYIFEPQADAYLFDFYMGKGSMIYNSGSIGRISPQSVRITTPKATVGIRGTRFIVDMK